MVVKMKNFGSLYGFELKKLWKKKMVWVTLFIMLAVIIMLLLLPALRNGKLSNGLYVGLVTSILNLVQGMSWNLAGIMQGIADVNAYLNDVGVFLGMEEKVDADAEPIKIPGFQVETIEFRNVYFRYPGREAYVLKDCSF